MTASSRAPTSRAPTSRAVGLAARYSYRVVWSQPDGSFIGTADEWPSLHTHGDTTVQAVEEILALVTACVDDVLASGDTPPTPVASSNTPHHGEDDITKALQVLVLAYNESELSRFRAGREISVVVTRSSVTAAALNAWYESYGEPMPAPGSTRGGPGGNGEDLQ